MLRSDSCSQCVSAPAPRFADPQSSPAMTGRQAVRRGMNVQVGPHDFAAVLRINSDAVPLRQWGQPLKTKAAVPAPYTSVGFVAGEALQREVCSRNRRRQEKAEAERSARARELRVQGAVERATTKIESCVLDADLRAAKLAPKLRTYIERQWEVTDDILGDGQPATWPEVLPPRWRPTATLRERIAELEGELQKAAVDKRDLRRLQDRVSTLAAALRHTRAEQIALTREVETYRSTYS